MSNLHLEELRSALERNHWRVVAELPGNEQSVSAVWRISRPDGSCPVHVEFAGLSENEVLPIEEAYGVNVREAPDVKAYFARPSRTWPSELGQFIVRLQRWADNSSSHADAPNSGAPVC